MVRRPQLSLAILSASVLSAATLLGAFPPAPAAAEGSADRRTEVAGQIEHLQKTDLELDREVARLQGEISANDRRADEARRQLADLERELGPLRADLEQAGHDLEVERRRATRRAVRAYMNPTPEVTAELIEAEDYDAAHRQRLLLEQVAHFDREVQDGRKAAAKAMAFRQQRLSAAQQRIDDLRGEAESAGAEAASARDRHVRAQQDLAGRIEAYQREADALAAQDAAVTAVIASQAAAGPVEVAGPPPGVAGTGSSGPTGGATAGGATGSPSTTVGQAAGTASADAARPSTTAAPAPAPSTTAPPTTAPRSAPTTAARAVTTVRPAPAAPTTTARPTTTTARPTPTTTVRSSGGVRLAWPVSGVLTSPYGMRWGRMHQGIDIGVPTGTPLRSAAAGSVIYCGWMGGYGNFTLVDHGGGIVTAYGHQSRLGCSLGQRVSAGQVIGYAGNTGTSTGPHLHFEVRVNGVALNPLSYLP